MSIQRDGVWFFFVLVLLTACGNSRNKNQGGTEWDKGTIRMSCDESFKPVIDKQVQVFESLNPEATIAVQYKPEAECLRDFSNDSISMVIATRGFSAAEGRMMADSLHTPAEAVVMAHDLIAVIVHPGARDSFFTMAEIRDLLTGKSRQKLIPVLDGTRATSTVRFMLDSVLRGQNLGKNVFAAEGSLGVIDYVSKTPNAVGFVGFSWIGNRDDPAEMANLRKVQAAYLESTDSAGAYVQPSQLFIYTGSYPLVRDLVYIVKEKQPGLAHSFARFLAGMQGQLIFKRAYLMPVILPNYIRQARLQDTINK